MRKCQHRSQLNELKGIVIVKKWNSEQFLKVKSSLELFVRLKNVGVQVVVGMVVVYQGKT